MVSITSSNLVADFNRKFQSSPVPFSTVVGISIDVQEYGWVIRQRLAIDPTTNYQISDYEGHSSPCSHKENGGLQLD